jgi:hypothetical protein
MTKHTRLFTAFFIFAAIGAGAVDFDPGAYGGITDYLSSIYGLDDNAGLTALPVLNVPMGGRSEGMATAFSAVCDDISFIEYNPAGSSTLPHSELALFHNNWIADTKLEGAAFTSRVKNFGYAAAAKWLYTPFTEYNMYGERASKGYYSEAVATLNASYNFLSGYYFSGVSLGINLKGAFRLVPDYSDDAGNILSGSGKSQSAAGFMADIGVLTRFDMLKFYQSRDRNASFALVMRNLGPNVKGDPLPAAATAALAYRPIRPVLLSFDFSLPFNMAAINSSEKPYGALGLSVDITSFLSMRAGLLAKSGNFRAVIGSAVTLGKVAFDINYSLDLLTQFRPINRVSVGLRFDLGDQGRNAKAEEVDKLYLAGLEAYSQGKNAEARFYWEEALKIEPRFDPAKEGLRILDGTQHLEDRINEMQHLNF